MFLLVKMANKISIYIYLYILLCATRFGGIKIYIINCPKTTQYIACWFLLICLTPFKIHIIPREKKVPIRPAGWAPMGTGIEVVPVPVAINHQLCVCVWCCVYARLQLILSVAEWCCYELECKTWCDITRPFYERFVVAWMCVCVRVVYLIKMIPAYRSGFY